MKHIPEILALLAFITMMVNGMYSKLMMSIASTLNMYYDYWVWPCLLTTLVLLYKVYSKLPGDTFWIKVVLFTEKIKGGPTNGK